ncbi:D-alanyl-D-alanine dipeptidase [compost metagenome]
MRKNPNFYGMKKIGILFLSVLLLAACGETVQQEDVEPQVPLSGEFEFETKQVDTEKTKSSEPVKEYLLYKGDTLVAVDHFNKNIWWELKYATADNFMRRVLYDTLKTVYVQAEVARRLAKSQDYLTQKNADYHLLVYDGLRPLSVQWEMWNALDTIPESERGKFVSNPRNGSVHNYGAAVDITICDQNRNPLDMGAGYDDIRKIAYPSLEAEFLASGELTQQQVNNRKLLRSALQNQGFSNIPTEWWHFNAFSRSVVKTKFQLVKNEFN